MHRHMNRRTVADIVSEHKQKQIAADLIAELNQSTQTWGMEITEVHFSDIKTIKKGEEPNANIVKNLSNPESAKEIVRTLVSCKDFMELQKELTKTITEAAKPTPMVPEDLGQNGKGVPKTGRQENGLG